ncbi:MAG: carboxylesterase [Pseudazoarcus pumilus]|nr:carboxylesterase [Pseudazoarcus pumilus]
MSLDAIEHETGPNPQASIIVMHGLGADGNDFVPICDQLDLTAVGPVRYVFPHAPVRPVTINGGYRMRAWFDILSFERGRNEDEPGLRESQAEVAALIDAEIARGVPAARIVLMGFSQGCAMTLMTGLRYPQRLAGLVGLSGYLPLPDTLAAERAPANADVPIFLAHGTADPVIPFTRAEFSRDVLTGLDYPVEWRPYNMVHTVTPQELMHIHAFLLKVLAR